MNPSEPQEPTAAPPGWYPQADGQVRWWNGSHWDGPPRKIGWNQSMAVRPHLGLFTLPVIAAVAIRMKYGENDAFVKHHATEALNAQIWFGILWNAVGLSMLASLVAAGEHHEDLFLAGWLTMAGSFVLAGAMAMRGAVMAYRQTWWRYPLLPYRFVREASSEPTGHKPADRSNSFGSSK